MTNTYIPQYFIIEELLPPPIFLPVQFRTEFYRQSQALFRLFDYRVLLTLDRLRKRYGLCVVNNWYMYDASSWNDLSSHMFRFAGWRPVNCEDGAMLSEHKFFRAMDCKFRNVTPNEIWLEMQQKVNAPEFEYIQRIEAFDGMIWFHFDMGHHDRYGETVKVIGGKSNSAGLPANIERAV